MRVLEVDKAGFEELQRNVAQFSDGTERKSLAKCGLVAGMKPDTKASNSGYIH